MHKTLALKDMLVLLSIAILVAMVTYLFKLTFLFPLSALLIAYTIRTRTNRQTSMVFLCVLLIGVLLPIGIELRYRILDIFFGSMIGYLAGLLIFPTKIETRFSVDINPILQNMKVWMENILKLNTNEFLIEKTFIKHYPEWVFERGFNPGLRSGLRFFLIRIEHIIESMFSLQYFLKNADKLQLEELSGALKTTIQTNTQLIDILIGYFSTKQIIATPANFIDDMQTLHDEFGDILPQDLEYLEVASSYLGTAAIFRDLQDIRRLLLELVSALPHAKS